MTSSSSISHLFRSVLGSPKKDQIKSNKTIPTGQSDAERYGLPADRIHVSDDSITGKRQKLAGETGITHPTAYFIKQRFFERYDLGKILGKGASAEVYLARHKRTGEKFAVKIIHRNNRMNDESTMATEVQILKAVQHTNVVSLFEIFETRDTIYLVLELAEDGDLIGGLAELPIYNEESIKDIFHQLLLAVHHLHERGIIHRDLKLDNLLYSRTDEDKIHVKITDFGLSAIVDETYFTKRSDNYSHSSHSSHSTSNDKNSSQRMKREKVLNQMWGTTEYFAPEVYARAYGRQADVWALGCILFEMLTGELAFPYRETPVGMMERVLLHGGKKPLRAFERKAGWQALSKEAKSLIKGMLKTSPVKRLSIEECLQHPWMQALHHKQQQQKLGLKLRHSSSNMSMTNTDSSSSSSPALSPSSSSHHSNANGNNDLSVCSVAFQYGEESSHNVGSPASTTHASSPLRMADEAERVAKGELVVARRIITERVDRRARRYNHLVAEVAMRPARPVSP